MTSPENETPLWTEDRVERLLTDFFQREIPVALREPAPVMPRRAVRPQAQPSRPNRPQPATSRSTGAGALMIGLSSLLMVLVALAVWPHRPADNPPTDFKSTESAPLANGSSVETSIPGLGTDKPGPVELRPRLPHVGVGDPDRETPDFPELDIEVFPLDRKITPESTPQLPESKLEPMLPRPLPESQPAVDPDEA